MALDSSIPVIKDTPYKNLILGTIRGYDFDQLKPFVHSLKRSGYRGDICLFVNAIDADTTNALVREGIQLRPYKEFGLRLPGNRMLYAYSHRVSRLQRFYPRLVNTLTLLSGPDRRGTRCRVGQRLLSLVCSRFLMYYAYLSKCSHLYSKVMLTDVRDVVFQRDPFDFHFDDCLCCFLEDKTIAHCPINSNLIVRAFGTRVLQQLSDRKISCAGVTIGTYRQVMQYLALMVDLLTALEAPNDQAVHNYIIYNKWIENLRIFDNHSGPVLTLGYVSNVMLNHEGKIVNTNGDEVNIVHQYDRHPRLQDKMLSLFA